jgi:hypothetical protein
VKKSHARIASAWERKNCDQVGPVRPQAGSIPLALRISHMVDAATLTPRPASSPWILRYPHSGFAGQPADQGLDVPPGRRPASPAAHGPGGPAAAHDVAVPAHDRVRGNQQPQPWPARFRYHAEQGREQGPVRPVQLQTARLPPLQHRELVAQEIKISAAFHLSSRRDSLSHAATRVIRRKTNRRHMIGDHHGRTAGKATLLVRVVDENSRHAQAMLGATRANDFMCQANEYGQAGGDHARSRTDPDDAERLTGIYGSEGLGFESLRARTRVPGQGPGASSSALLPVS